MPHAKSTAAKKRPSETDRTSTGVRMNFVFPETTIERLRNLQVSLGAKTVTSTVERALQLAEWYSNQKAKNRDILVRDPGSDPVIVEFLF